MVNKNNNFFENNNNNIQFIKCRQKEEINSRFYNTNEKNKIYSVKNNNESIKIKNIFENNNKILNIEKEKEKNDIKLKRTKSTSKTKNKKFDIIDLLGQPSLEMESFNKMIVGLKDVKVMKYKAKKEEKEEKNIKNEEINNKLRNIDNNVSRNNILSRSYRKNKNEIKIKINQKEKYKDILPVNFLRIIDKSIDMNNNIKDRYKNTIKQENIPIIIEEENENDNDKEGIILIQNKKKEVKKMDKIFKEFNNTKEVVNSLEEYISVINNLFNYIINKIETNIFLLNDILNSNYILLLNNISPKEKK